MTDPNEELVRIGNHPTILRVVFAAGALALGIVLMMGFMSLYQEPEVTEPPAPVLRSSAIVVHPQDFQTTLSGFGTARSRVHLDIRPEVSGRVESMHPRIEVGLVVPQDDILFTIEKADYESRLAEADAEVMRLTAELERLKREEQNDRRRLEVVAEQRELAQEDYKRIESLFRQGGAESQSRLDQARNSLLQREEAVVNLESNLALYESRLQATEAQLRTGQARRTSAARDLERTEVRAPFDARVTMKDIEVGKYVTAGQTILTLANDRTIEIPVSLESSEVSRWLDVFADPMDVHWFRAIEDHPVTIRWAEQVDGAVHKGMLDRVESYQADTRTFTFIVNVDASPTGKNGDEVPSFPLTDGMFCHVEIPGRLARDVYVIPREAVDSRGNVLAVRDGRLQTLPVEVARNQDNVALIRQGLEPGEVVIISRPANVVDGTKVDPTMVAFDTNGELSR